MTSRRSEPATDPHEDEQLDRVFAALSDPVRRRILKSLQGEPLLVSELAKPFAISLQAVSRHIGVLEDAGLIHKERTGRISRCSLTLGPIVGAAVWINHYSRYWQGQFDLLAATLTQLDEQRQAAAQTPPRTRRAEPAASTRKPPAASTRKSASPKRRKPAR